MSELKPLKIKPLSEVSKKTKHKIGKSEDKEELVEEHERLVDVLDSESHEDDKKESKIQSKELKDMKEEVKADTKKSLDRAIDLIKSIKISLNEDEMDIQKKYKSKAQQGYMHAAEARGETSEEVVDEFDEKTKDYKKLPEKIKKALKAAAVLGLSKKARMDVAYRIGLAAGVQSFPFETTDLSDEPLDIGISKEALRPSYEPPVVPIRRIDTPNPVVPKKCSDHEYKVAKVGSQEAIPFWRR